MGENVAGKKDGVISFRRNQGTWAGGQFATRGIHMNTRERFLAVLDFNKDVHSLKWDFGIWGEAVDNWYAQGLPKKNYPVISKKLTTPTASLYGPAWRSVGEGKLAKGLGVMVGGLYWPTQAFPLGLDVRDYFHMDQNQQLVDVNLLFAPMFDIQVLHEDDEAFDYIDVDGVERHFLKAEGTIPTSMKWPIKDKKSWEKLKDERLSLKNISSRFPDGWEERVKEYRQRDYPLAVGGYPHGFFGTLSHLIGYENLFYWYHDEPCLSTTCSILLRKSGWRFILRSWPRLRSITGRYGKTFPTEPGP